jgi:SAM-dependent methyltransferase
MSEPLPHSAIYFGDSRDHWWHADQLELFARRLDLGRRRRVLDVGCGYGHWGRALLPLLAPDVHLSSIDPEARSVAEAERRTTAFTVTRGHAGTFDWQVAYAERLPFADGTFDLVTAQTVLIHVHDVAVVIAELTRVLAPGGLLLLAEPNNVAGVTAALIDGPEVDPELVLTLTELELRIQRGKYKLGEGFNSAGEYLVRYLDPRAYTDVRGWLCDRSYPMTPPYAEPGARADLADLREFQAQGWYNRAREDALRYYLAGGGDVERFAQAWAMGLAHDAARLARAEAGHLYAGGGHVFHVVAATRRGLDGTSAGTA